MASTGDRFDGRVMDIELRGRPGWPRFAESEPSMDLPFHGCNLHCSKKINGKFIPSRA
jgi:hypothetical protein